MDNLNSELLRFSVRGKSGADAFRAAINPHFSDSTFEFMPGSKDFTAQISICRLGKIQIFSGRYEQPFRLLIPDAHSFVQGFPAQGNGECVNNGVVMRLSSGRGAVSEPGEMKVDFGSNFDDVCVFMDRAAVIQQLAQLLGAFPGAELKLDRSNAERRSPTRLSFRLLKLLAVELAAEETIPSPLMIAELEQAILVAFLCATPHNYSLPLQAAPAELAPPHVRRVEEYIEATWDQPVTIEALTIVANASARSIFHSFKKHRGVSPMNFVKQVRLRHVQQMLSRPASETTVTSAAFACGFGNLGHFASAYKKAFGETPSGTLSRAKGQSSLCP